MKVEIEQTNHIAAFVGIRANSYMSDLGSGVKLAFDQLHSRRNEINNIKNPNVTYGITPPNYKGNPGLLDFYCCYEVQPIGNVPHGMVHIHLLPRTYSVTHYKGPAGKTHTAYDYTSKWLEANGYSYDDIDYYFEKYDEKTIRNSEDERNEFTIYCPVKKKGVST